MSLPGIDPTGNGLPERDEFGEETVLVGGQGEKGQQNR